MGLTYERKCELAEVHVTLNGHRAAITGAMNDFATVRDLGTGLSAEWSWETVERIVTQKGGAFRS